MAKREPKATVMVGPGGTVVYLGRAPRWEMRMPGRVPVAEAIARAEAARAAGQPSEPTRAEREAEEGWARAAHVLGLS